MKAVIDDADIDPEQRKRIHERVGQQLNTKDEYGNILRHVDGGYCEDYKEQIKTEELLAGGQARNS